MDISVWEDDSGRWHAVVPRGNDARENKRLLRSVIDTSGGQFIAHASLIEESK